MRTYEGISAAYFLLLALGAAFAVANTARRLAACAGALTAAYAVWTVSALDAVARDWAPLAYIAAAYWIPAVLVSRPIAPATVPHSRFERWLLRTDVAWRRHLPSIPRWAVPVLEIAYLACYPLVPLGFLVVFVGGTADDVNRFWTAVLMSGFACYGTLPWLWSRPPRLLAPAPQTSHSVARFNVFMLGKVSHGWNTFPSGHAAMAIAVAAALVPVSVPAAIVTAVVAAAVATGAAVGRYHYAIDVVLGAVVAAVSAFIARGL